MTSTDMHMLFLKSERMSVELCRSSDDCNGALNVTKVCKTKERMLHEQSVSDIQAFFGKKKV